LPVVADLLQLNGQREQRRFGVLDELSGGADKESSLSIEGSDVKQQNFVLILRMTGFPDVTTVVKEWHPVYGIFIFEFR
jgi:hypothetical protein